MKRTKSHEDVSQLVVGGHSFIPELGNDPAIDFDMQLMIVNECLDQGINCFDTTYEPERIGLGRVLEKLGRRDEAVVIAWNFFADGQTGEYLGRPDAYEAEHIERMMGELRTDYIDMLVVHPVQDDAKNDEQGAMAQSWVEAGYVGRLGIWDPGDYLARQGGGDDPYDFMVMQRSIQWPNAEVFRSSKARGWETFATSPFHRGWLLDKMVAVDAEHASEGPEAVRARIANALLRFSIHDPHVDHVIVGIRKKEWISRNLESMSMGPLSEGERRWLLGLLERAEAVERQ